MDYIKGSGRLAHLYHLKHDGMDVGYTIAEIVALAEQLGWDAEVEAQYPVPDPVVEPVVEETPPAED
jgi:hypothetical protein